MVAQASQICAVIVELSVSAPYKIIIIESREGNSEIEEYIRSHCSGHIGEIRSLASEEEFVAALDEGEWDVVLSGFDVKGFPVEDALRIVNRRGLDLPHIVVGRGDESHDAMSILYAGAEHVVERNEIERLCITVPRSIANARRRREIARELDAHRRNLEKLVASRTEELERVNERLEYEISKRKLMEDALRESESQYRNLVENAHDGICIIQDQRVQFINRRLEQMMGYEAGSIVGTVGLNYNPPEERNHLMGLYRSIIKGEEDILQVDTILVKRNGQRMDVSMSASAIDYHGRRAVMVVIRDITERKRIGRVALENEKLEAVGVVARGVGANFSNIMGVISSYAASISDSFLPHTRPHDAARKILDATRHASALTKRLLSVVQISESNSTKASLGAVSLSDALSTAAELVAHTMQANGIKLVIKRKDSLPSVIADRNQLVDVLMSIFMNAIDAMPDGGTLAIKAIERRIARPRSNPSSPGGRFVGLSIYDDGVGMTKDAVSRAFEPFYTTKEDENAFGLGLPVAQSMALSWGGWIDIRSRPGKGTRVRIFMPKTAPEPTMAADSRRVNMTVLVVDDNQGRRSMIAGVMRDRGHRVIEAGDGNAAIELYRRHATEIDLSIVDWILPVADGKAVLKAIMEYDSQAKVIMVSGFSRDYVRSQVRLGAWGFLQKPFSTEELVREVERVCSHDA